MPLLCVHAPVLEQSAVSCSFYVISVSIFVFFCCCYFYIYVFILILFCYVHYWDYVLLFPLIGNKSGNNGCNHLIEHTWFNHMCF